jgi:hypothetical protein
VTAARADSCSLRAAGEAIAVALVPLVAYWQTIFHDYAFRDDYAHLREVHESPGSLVLFTAAHGRPLYGVLLEGSIAPLHLVADLPWLRLLAAALVIATALVLAREMRRQGWSGTEAAAAGTALTLLPATQMTVGWAIAWPNAAALLLGICGFVLLDRALHGARWKAVPACAAYFASGLIYPSNALFAVVPLATALLVRAHKTPVRTALLHLGALFGSVGAGFVLMKAMFAAGVLLPAARLHFESDIVGKLLWFLGQPVPNALALFALRDRFGTGATLFASCAVGVALLIVIGLTVAVRRKLVPAGTVACCVLALPVAAHAVSLAAGDSAIGYRTTFALAAPHGGCRRRRRTPCSPRASRPPRSPRTSTAIGSSPSRRAASGAWCAISSRSCRCSPASESTSCSRASSIARRSACSPTSSGRSRPTPTGCRAR